MNLKYLGIWNTKSLRLPENPPVSFLLSVSIAYHSVKIINIPINQSTYLPIIFSITYLSTLSFYHLFIISPPSISIHKYCRANTNKCVLPKALWSLVRDRVRFHQPSTLFAAQSQLER